LSAPDAAIFYRTTNRREHRRKEPTSMAFREGDRIRNRQSGRVATVTRTNPTCGNVWIGHDDEMQEISPIAWDYVPQDAPTQEPPPPAPSEPVKQPVAINGNGHSNGHSDAPLPPLRSFAGRVRRALTRA
jgi:hypothetical protein